MVWLGLFIKYGLPLAVKLGWVNDAEKLLVEGWYAAKHIKTFPDEPYPSGVNGQRDNPPVSIQVWRKPDR